MIDLEIRARGDSVIILGGIVSVDRIIVGSRSSHMTSAADNSNIASGTCIYALTKITRGMIGFEP